MGVCQKKDAVGGARRGKKKEVPKESETIRKGGGPVSAARPQACLKSQRPKEGGNVAFKKKGGFG